MTELRTPLLTHEQALDEADRIIRESSDRSDLRYVIAKALVAATLSGAEEVYERTRSKLASAGESR